MKSILFIAFLALATIGCDTPESTMGSDTSTPADSQTMPSTTDTAMTTPIDTTTSLPADTTTNR